MVISERRSRQVVDRPAVVLGIDDGHGLRREPREILRHRQLADLLVGRQEGLDGDRIGGLAHPDDVAGDLEDLAVQRLEQMDGLQEVRDAVEGVVVDEDRAEQRLLGLDVARRLAVEGGRLVAGEFELACGVVHSRHSSPEKPAALAFADNQLAPRSGSAIPIIS